MTYIVAALIALIAWLLARCIAYKCAVRGLLYYLGMKYDDMPDADKLKELRNAALKRYIDEFTGKV